MVMSMERKKVKKKQRRSKEGKKSSFVARSGI
jgi:hypothetical protein